MYTIDDFINQDIAIVFSKNKYERTKQIAMLKEICQATGIEDEEDYIHFAEDNLYMDYNYGGGHDFGGVDEDNFYTNHGWKEIPFEEFDFNESKVVFVQEEFSSMFLE